MVGISEIKIAIISLGCPKALVDSEYMVTCLKSNGLTICEDYRNADIIIINTCGFLKSSVQESIETIENIKRLKKSGICKGIIVAGCLVERYPEKIIKEHPEVDAVLGNSHFEDILIAVKEVFNGHSYKAYSRIKKSRSYYKTSYKLTPPHYAYVKISEGCDHLCYFCVIPRIKGKLRSRPLEEIKKEVEELSKKGTKEIILIAQDTTEYGKDIYNKNSLSVLIEELAKNENVKWIRILYAYPSNIDHNLIEVMNRLPKVCKYIDVPLQHASDKILKLMGRKGKQSDYKSLIKEMRGKIKGLVMRTTFIVGYPGETKEEFDTLMRFVEEMKFERLGIFAYSRERGTKSYNLKPQISEKLKKDRVARLAILQQEISARFTHSFVGKTLQVICDQRSNDGQYMESRSYFDAPDIDGIVYIKDSKKELRPGDMLEVRITDATEYDLIGCKK